MEKSNAMTNIIVAAVVGIFVFCGCSAKTPEVTGFLSDYSKLSAQSNTSFRYVAPGNELGNYSKFIIDPVEIRFYTGSKAEAKTAKGKLSEKDIAEIKNLSRRK